MTSAQVIALRTAASKVFGPCDCQSSGGVCDYHHWLASNFGGICSSKDLSAREAMVAIGMLRKLCGYKPKRPRYTGQGRANSGGVKRITEAQARKIGALARLLKWESSSVRKFIKRQTGQNSDVQMLMQHQAQKVIIGMQRILSGDDHAKYTRLNTFEKGL